MSNHIKKAIMGIKVGMTQIFTEEGEAIPVTVVEAGPCVVLQKKKVETDGYNAIQVGFYNLKEKLANKPTKGHFKKANVEPLRYIREFRVNNVDDYEIGQEISAEIFQEGDVIDVVGTSKGKGFTGVVKRHNFSKGYMSHGSRFHRGPGSLGAKGPARIFKGKKLPGRMGGERVTVQCLKVVKVYSDRNIILIKGAIPGPKKGLVIIKDSVKAS